MATLRKLALRAARADRETKSNIIGRRKQMAWGKILPEEPIGTKNLFETILKNILFSVLV
jgi:hypothetical protein